VKKRNLSGRRKILSRFARAACVLTLLVALVAPIPPGQAATSTFALVWSTLTRAPRTQQATTSQTPSRTQATRIKLLTQNIQELTYDEPIVAVTVVDPSIASAATRGERSVVVTGLKAGETLLIISGTNSRRAYVVEVVRPPRRAVARADEDVRHNAELASYTGFYALHFAPGFDGAPSLLRHSYDFEQKLSGARTLRSSGDFFNFTGRGERGLAEPLGVGFGVNRIRLGIDSPGASFDLLDSELEISRLSFNNYTMRGAHFASKPDSRWRGLEMFVGRVRPQVSLFNEGEGFVAGALAPVAVGESWRVRVGAFFISPESVVSGERAGGMVWQADARYYSPDERTTAEAETTYSSGGLSWRARLDLRRRHFNFSGEVLRLDPHSPLVSIGAQASGRKSGSVSLQWQPDSRFAASVAYHRTTNYPISTSRRLELNSRTFNLSARYMPARGARLGFSFNEQEIETPTALRLPFLLNLRTRTLTARYDQRIANGWANELEARLSFNREDRTSEGMTRSISLREALRYSWRRAAITGFVNYKANTPSLAGLVLRNPLLLPAELRPSFAADPARFLLATRDTLPQLLPGVALPATRSTEAGIRLQAAFSRVNIAAETRYSIGEILARSERNVLTTFSANFKLDAANSIQVSGARSFSFDGAGNRNALTVSYLHRFGAGGGGGFQFAKLLGLDRGRIEGRAFLDLNGNGADDADEPGVPGMTVQLDATERATTDARGRFHFASLKPGVRSIRLLSDDLGARLRASVATVRQVEVSARQTARVSFSLNNFGAVAGRVFNDLLLARGSDGANMPGVGGVRLRLLRTSTVEASDAPTMTESVDARGAYEFRNLLPGQYILEIDPASLPPSFDIPAQTIWPLTISPLGNFYFDIPLTAQRAISGIVFLDRDGDGLFDPRRDEALAGARVLTGSVETVTDQSGSYMLRGLPAGRVELFARLRSGKESRRLPVELDASPTIRRAINIPVAPHLSYHPSVP
jgi:hypothetical protein